MNALLFLTLVLTATETRQSPDLQATTPTRDLIALAKIVQADSHTHWPDFRALSFTSLPERDAARVKKDVRFFVETLNRVAPEAQIREVADNLWAIDIASLRFKPRDWDALARRSAYYAGSPERAVNVLRARFETRTPIMRADEFVRNAWEPEWYAKFLDLPTNRSRLFSQVGVATDFTKQIDCIGVVPDSGVQNNPRKVAYLKTGKGRDLFVTMNYENRRGKNDSLRFPTHVDCNYNEIAIEMPNGLDFYYANAGGGGSALRDAPRDELVDRLGNGDAEMGGLVKQIPFRAGTDHVHSGQILLGLSCVSCHTSGAQDLVAKLVSLSDLRFTDARMSKDRIAELYDNAKLSERASKASHRWRLALLVINGRTPEENEASWKKTFADFDANVDLGKAAIEVGASEKTLRRRINVWLESNRDQLVSAILDRSISRVEFEQIFPTLRGLFDDEDGHASQVLLSRYR